MSTNNSTEFDIAECDTLEEVLEHLEPEERRTFLAELQAEDQLVAA